MQSFSQSSQHQRNRVETRRHPKINYSELIRRQPIKPKLIAHPPGRFTSHDQVILFQIQGCLHQHRPNTTPQIVPRYHPGRKPLHFMLLPALLQHHGHHPEVTDQRLAMIRHQQSRIVRVRVRIIRHRQCSLHCDRDELAGLSCFNNSGCKSP